MKEEMGYEKRGKLEEGVKESEANLETMTGCSSRAQGGGSKGGPKDAPTARSVFGG